MENKTENRGEGSPQVRHALSQEPSQSREVEGLRGADGCTDEYGVVHPHPGIVLSLNQEGHLLQRGWTSRAGCSVTQARHKKTDPV